MQGTEGFLDGIDRGFNIRGLDLDLHNGIQRVGDAVPGKEDSRVLKQTANGV